MTEDLRGKVVAVTGAGSGIGRATAAAFAAAVARVVTSCLELGGLDVMVANAGVSRDRPCLEVTEQDLHIRAYGRYHDDGYYIQRPATATRSEELRYVPATCHLDINEGHRWEFLGDIGIQLPSVSIGAKRGAYDGNAENAQKRIRRMWRTWYGDSSIGGRVSLHNKVYGFRKINYDSYTVYGGIRKSVMFRWHRSDGWATTLRM